MNFSQYYHTRIQTSVADDRVRILSVLQDAIRQGTNKVRLSTYYKGLPISYPAGIAGLDCGVLDLDVHQQQAVALQSVGRAFVRCDCFDGNLLAEVQSVDVRRLSVTLKNFTFVEVMAERRESLRLAVEPQTEAVISGAIGRTLGLLSDISLGGCCIHTETGCPFRPGTPLKLKLQVPNLLQKTVTCVESEARYLENFREAGDQICSFAFEPDDGNETLISRFLFQRQVEIIRELKDSLTA
jgi:hypothetical protein